MVVVGWEFFFLFFLFKRPDLVSDIVSGFCGKTSPSPGFPPTRLQLHTLSTMAPLLDVTPTEALTSTSLSTSAIIEQVDPGKQSQRVDFDAKTHLAASRFPEVVMMKDLGYPEDVGISPVAVSMPFRLFSSEAVQQMRAEIFKPEVMENCRFSSNIAPCQLRGYAAKYAPFTYDAWTHPDTLAKLSKIAGVDLVPWNDYEIAHINLSTKTTDQAKEELDAMAGRKNTAGGASDDDKPIVGWHTDSYPFVCVLMLSDCSNMVGGETALLTANGKVIRVRGPQEGCAVILQGRYITHQALRALGGKERITAVTSFRPASAMVKDDSVLTTVRPISDLSELYNDYAEYRLEIMEERIRHERKLLAARRKGGKKFDTLGHKKFLEDMMGFARHTDNEIVEDSKVIPGFVEERDIPDVIIGAEDAKKDVKAKL